MKLVLERPCLQRSGQWLRSFEWPDPVGPGLTGRFACGGAAVEKERPGRVRPGLPSQKERSQYYFADIIDAISIFMTTRHRR